MFDEEALVASLTKASPLQRMAFAVRVASRVSKTCRFSARLRPHTALLFDSLGHLRQSISQGDSQCAKYLDGILNLLPDDEPSWSFEDAIDDHALSSIAYALRCHASGGSAREAAWCARRAYEAADQAVLTVLGDHANEDDIDRHPWTMRELSRQRKDLELATNRPLDVALAQKPEGEEEFLTLEEFDLAERSWKRKI